ncbi:MAG: hypothetical protein Pg6A_11690 [Termitinemataceae bacterium]|nr:MAG: hypothetical protein Pg6A_11690 [Termitinemataceae bacterium]
MIHNISQPELSPYFSVDDIRKIREWNYGRFKDATFEERYADIKKGSDNFLCRLAKLKSAKSN